MFQSLTESDIVKVVGRLFFSIQFDSTTRMQTYVMIIEYSCAVEFVLCLVLK